MYLVCIYLVLFHPIIEIDYYYRQYDYECLCAEHVISSRRTQSRKNKEELKAEIQNGNLFIENKTMLNMWLVSICIILILIIFIYVCFRYRNATFFEISPSDSYIIPNQPL